MSEDFVVPAETDERQRRASDPTASAWVSANAGSGKTFVLTRRVIRILLAGTPANRILCLTFTKAAAATMSNRVFGELAKWATLDDARLTAALEAVEGPGRERDAARLAAARRLFAQAIETPGGLKIQTIHAFCESILQQFPIEADLGGNFAVLDESLEREAIQAAREAVLVEASAAAADDPIARALRLLLAEAGEFSLNAALDAVISARDDVLAWLRRAGDLDACLAELAAVLGVEEGESEATIVAEMLASPEFPPELVDRLIEDFAGSSANDRAQAEKMRTARSTAASLEERAAAWWAVFFTKQDLPKAERSLATKATTSRHPDLIERMFAETVRLARLADRRAALASLAATSALLRLGDRVIGRYEAGKRARGVLDFDDLVGRTADLLSRSDAAQWVQYKLDKGIDHVLIDEAQDSNPRQWRIVRGLTEEFFAGEGARRKGRTVFAVGDEKQSIYSFQGAAPDTFSQNRRHFQSLAEGAGGTFADVALNLSFRSTTAVLDAVDAVFADPERCGRLLSDSTRYTPHTAARARAPGRVEVWPVVETEVTPEPQDWVLPLDRPSARAAHVRLAHEIADEIGRLLAPGRVLEGTGRPVRPKDVIVLVRKRGPFVDAMNRVLKERGIAVAGQDRLLLTDHIAVADLMALGRALTMPEDDLSLACLLKSPLLGRDDDDLIRLAAVERGEGETLAAALERLGTHDEGWRETAGRLARWRDLAVRVPTFELYARILSAEGGRRRFVERLGSEADDVLDEFLSLALAADAGPAPSLTRFIEGLAADAPSIKRAIDEERDEVRVMTVHGAKGLESAVVFLVDSGGEPVQAAHDPKLIALPAPGGAIDPAPVLVWSRGKADPQIVAGERTARREAAGGEYLRLLYVAMTRAADRLYVCGFAGARGASPRAWHALVADALGPGAETIEIGDGRTRAVWLSGPRAAVAPQAATAEEASEQPGLPDWIERPAPVTAPMRRLTPSALGEEAGAGRRLSADRVLAAAEAPDDAELQRGVLTHRLFEVLPNLPPERRGAAARRFVAARGGRLDEVTREAIVAEVEAVLDDPRFAAAFGPQARAEVAIAGRTTSPQGEEIEISGRIDRLVVDTHEVLAVDFKTDRAGAGAEAHLGQMALYRRLLGEIFPGRRVRMALLWTAVPRLEVLDEEALAAVARRIATT